MISAPPISESELHGAKGQAGPAPKEVELSFWLWIAGAVLSVISALLLFGRRDELLAEIRKQPDVGKLSQTEVDGLVTVSLVSGVVIALVLAGLYLLFAFKARAGRNWARIVLTILTALSVAGQLIGGELSWLGILSALVAVAAVVLLFLPASNQYFASARRTS